mmetsp:Transcript_39118/g.91103  ORF Transcript_39118/g.91103 Transcript_39118/m.91103 type:complete len:249 (-) Transcript_39118:229-975(-)
MRTSISLGLQNVRKIGTTFPVSPPSRCPTARPIPHMVLTAAFLTPLSSDAPSSPVDSLAISSCKEFVSRHTLNFDKTAPARRTTASSEDVPRDTERQTSEISPACSAIIGNFPNLSMRSANTSQQAPRKKSSPPCRSPCSSGVKVVLTTVSPHDSEQSRTSPRRPMAYTSRRSAFPEDTSRARRSATSSIRLTWRRQKRPERVLTATDWTSLEGSSKRERMAVTMRRSVAASGGGERDKRVPRSTVAM